MKTQILIFFLFTQFIFAQNRTCGTQDYMNRLLSDPVESAKYFKLQAKFEIELQKLKSNANRVSGPNTKLIPIAVHFPDVPTTSDLKSCLRILAQSQVNILNADYNGTNADISNWTPAVNAFYPLTSVGSLDVQFTIASSNHPVGSGLSNGDLAVTFGTNFLSAANTDSQWAGYINLVCRDAGSGILGYSPVGGSPLDGATVVINTFAFGSGAGCAGFVPAAPYDLGRTLTHELGHFFNLRHPFKSSLATATSCVGTDADGLEDTPKQARASGGCPIPGSKNSCTAGQKVLSPNYMDYTNDACMYMFTAGQATRMLAYYNTVSPQLLTNVLSSNEFLTNNFSIIPNPNNGFFTINLKQEMDNYSVQVFDLTGKIIFDKDYFKNQNLQQNISLDNAAKGIYFVNIKSDNAILTKKIMVN